MSDLGRDPQGLMNDISRQVQRNTERLIALEEREQLDRELLIELHGEHIAHVEQVAHLEAALTNARRIGAAIGIIMAHRKVTEHQAFELLRTASNHRNVKLHVVALEVVETGTTTAVDES